MKEMRRRDQKKAKKKKTKRDWQLGR
jgi:hypothetical protein